MFRNKKTRTLIVVMGVLFITVIIISQWYYKRENAAVDPRIVPARELYKKYNTYASLNNFDSIFFLMDTIESIYSSFPHYMDSYEIAVLHNNRSAAYLTMGLFDSSLVQTERDSIIVLGEIEVRKSISLYKNWKKSYGDLSETDILSKLEFDFYVEELSPRPHEQKAYLDKRVNEISEAILEIDRRLSVSYTNLGIVYRHRMQYDSAALCYQEALELWEQNLTAENNLNILLGRPQKKRNFIQRMFPPDRL